MILLSSGDGTPRWLSILMLLCAVGFLVATLRHVTRRSTSKTVRRRLRARSIGSTDLMVAGTMPQVKHYDTIINIAASFEPALSLKALREAVGPGLLEYQRFHSVPMQPYDGGPTSWILREVDLTKHFIAHDVMTEEDAQSLIELLANSTLEDKARPWWEVHLVQARATPSKCRVFFRIHHGIGDGVSLVEAMSPLLKDATTGAPLDVLGQFQPKHLHATQKKKAFVWSLIRGVGYWLSFAQESLRIGAGTTGKGDPPTKFCHGQWPLVRPRVAVYLPTHSLKFIKALKDKAGKGVTVNDVEFGLFAGAVRRFLAARDPDIDLSKVRMRSLTPFALVEPVDPVTKSATLLRNLFTFVPATLPVAPATVKERIRASHLSWARLKSTAAVPAAFFMHWVGSITPMQVQRQTVVDLMTRHSLVFSNVPGPQKEVTLCGSKLKAVHMIYPNLTPQVGMVSVNGEVHACIAMMQESTGTFDVRVELPKYFQEELVAASEAYGIPL